MAAPSYTTDLTIFDDGANSTGWIEMTNMGVGGGPTDETDLAIYGTTCVSQQSRKTGLASMAYDNGAGVTIGTNEGFFVWAKYFAPNGLETLAAGGVGVVIGSAAGDWGTYWVDGSDTYAYGGWINYFVDPTLTADAENGTYGTTYQFAGVTINIITATSKGNPHTADIIRYGRGESRFTDGDLANGYATFDGYALVNDDPTTGRFGLLQDVGGSYLWKGLMLLGTGTTTSVDMRDSNVNITIADTFKALAPFNRIEVHSTSSNIEWTSVNITALGTTSKGEFEMIDNATVAFDKCNFSDMSTFIFQSNATGITNCAFLRCDQVTQGGGTFDGCSFDQSIAAVSILVDNLNKIDNCTFISDGSNHAIELTTAHSGNSYTLAGCTYEGYATVSGVTGNEVIYNNSSGHTIINISGGDVPTIRNGIGATTAIVADTTVTITGLKDLTEVRVYDNATLNPQIELAGIEDAIDGTTDNRSFEFALPSSTVVDIVFHNKSYDSIPPRSIGFIIPVADTSFSIVQLFDPNYNGSGL